MRFNIHLIGVSEETIFENIMIKKVLDEKHESSDSGSKKILRENFFF